MNIHLIFEVTSVHSDHEDEPTVTERMLGYGFFTDAEEAEEVVRMLSGMSGQDNPNNYTPYDPTGCNVIENFTTVEFEVREVKLNDPEDSL
jgi:hypothetical protein